MEFGFNLIASDLTISSVYTKVFGFMTSHVVWGRKKLSVGPVLYHLLKILGQDRYLNTTHSH